MAQVSLTASTEFESEIEVSASAKGDFMSLRLNTMISPGHWYAKDWVTIHGNPEAIRLLIEKMQAALPKPEPISPVDLENLDLGHESGADLENLDLSDSPF